MHSGQRFAADFARDGYAIIPGVLAEPALAALIAVVDALPEPPGRRRGGVRGLGSSPEVQALARSVAVRGVAEPVLGGDAQWVRCIFFDKVPDANWKVPWHQDLTIAVREQMETAGYGPWSVKDGVAHVQPPATVLEEMVAVRVHLDDCDAWNGPVRVLPGTHLRGRVPEVQMENLAAAIPAVTCAVPAGGILLMRPLLVHASSPAERPAYRRVIHLEFAAGRLTGNLEWHLPTAGGNG
jgi:ectoine hydroxylase-related dioxygenase (phytanoyl-CoA dioxygenase family)